LFGDEFELKWLAQIRYLPAKWESVLGTPFCGFVKGENEIDFYLAVRQKIDNIIIFSWADLYCEVQSINAAPMKRGEDFMSGIRWNNTMAGDLEFLYQKKDKIEMNYLNGLPRLQMYIKNYYSFTLQNIMVLKWKTILLEGQDEKGSLLQIQTPKMGTKKYYILAGIIYFD